MGWVYFGLLIADGPTEQKLNNKHRISKEQVQAAIQWPARGVRAKWENHPDYGWRVVAVGMTEGKPVLGILKPVPDWDDNADTWEIKTARWLRES